MMTNEVIYFGIAFLAGTIMGYAYFYGLWWTVQRMAASASPYRLMLSSFFLRLTLVMAGFYLLLQWGWQLIAVALIGFVAVRMAVIRRWGLKDAVIMKSMEKTDGI